MVILPFFFWIQGRWFSFDIEDDISLYRLCVRLSVDINKYSKFKLLSPTQKWIDIFPSSNMSFINDPIWIFNVLWLLHAHTKLEPRGEEFEYFFGYLSSRSSFWTWHCSIRCNYKPVLTKFQNSSTFPFLLFLLSDLSLLAHQSGIFKIVFNLKNNYIIKRTLQSLTRILIVGMNFEVVISNEDFRSLLECLVFF